MIFAECVHCDADISYDIPEDVRLPALTVIRCASCGRPTVCRVSRIDPKGWTLEEGLAEFGGDPGAVDFIRRAADEVGKA